MDAAADAGPPDVSLRATAWLAAATALLAAFVYLHEIRGGSEGAGDRIFPAVSADALESLSLEREGAPRLRASRIAAAWRVVEPVSAPADPAVLAALGRTLAELRSAGRIDDPVEPAVYGLDPPQLRVVFVHAGQELRFALGRETPVGPNLYASVPGREGAPEIHMLPVSQTAAFDVDVDALRDHRVLAFEPEDATRLRLAAGATAGGFEATLEREAEGWRIVAPAVLAADADAVGRLLSDLSLLRAEEFVDAATPDALRALAEPAFVAVVETGSGPPQRFELAPPGEDELRWVRGREGQLFRVRDALVRHFPRRLFALRAKQVLRFDPAEASAVRVELASGESFALPPEARIVEPLSRLDAVDVIAESLGADERAALGLEPARARIRVLAADDRVLADLLVGRDHLGRGRAARVVDADTIFALGSALSDALPLEAEGLEALARSGDEDVTESVE